MALASRPEMASTTTERTEDEIMRKRGRGESRTPNGLHPDVDAALELVKVREKALTDAAARIAKLKNTGLAEARRADSKLQADAIRASKKDPGSPNADAVRKELSSWSDKVMGLQQAVTDERDELKRVLWRLRPTLIEDQERIEADARQTVAAAIDAIATARTDRQRSLNVWKWLVNYPDGGLSDGNPLGSASYEVDRAITLIAGEAKTNATPRDAHPGPDAGHIRTREAAKARARVA